MDPKTIKTKSVTPTMQRYFCIIIKPRHYCENLLLKRLYKIVNDDLLKIIEDVEATNKSLITKPERTANLSDHLKTNALNFEEK